jgi:hypothetical protein
MANVVYDYPKSSCNCYKCTEKGYKFPKDGYPTNMSVENCQFPRYFECYDKGSFGSNIEPANKQGITNLNPEVMSQQYAKGFFPTTCPKTVGGSCPSNRYISADPRLVSNQHNMQRLTLDRPPITGEMKLKDLLHDPVLDKFGQGYKDYTDINAGQILYYNDKSIEDPFFTPNFVTSATTEGVLYQDPMGAMKPQYYRKPLTDNNPMGPERSEYEGCLSWMQDSLTHRQDLLSKQMLKRNQQRYTPRWYGL